MSKTMTLHGMIADHPTPKISQGGVSFTLNSRDYKGVMIVVVSESDRNIDCEQPSGELLRSRCLQQYVGDGENK